MIATDAGKTIKSAPSATAILVVNFIEVVITTSAAQVLTVQGSGGTVVFGVIEASVAAGVRRTFGPYVKGVPLPAGENLVVSAAAGVAAELKAEGWVDGS